MEEPIWVREARANYHPVSLTSHCAAISKQTHIGRASLAADMLEEMLPKKNIRPVHVLYVGIGRENHPLLCPYTPFFLHAYLESKGIEYRLTFIESDRDIVSDVKQRRRLFLSNPDYKRETQRREWDAYLLRTNQTGWEAHEASDDLIFTSTAVSGDVGLDEYLERGFKGAVVSDQFQRDVCDGKIQLIQSDIAFADLPADLTVVSLRNLLYLLSREGQMLALYNIARNMAPQGILLLDDMNYPGCSTVLPMLNGWFDG